MDERRSRIHDDLRGLLGGDLLFEPIQRAPYAVDASLYEIDPLGVVAPRNEDDLVSLVRYAATHAIPLHARGAGTGLAGESLGPGLVIDFSRYFRRIVEIGPEHVVVQPGVVVDSLNAQLAAWGRRLGPDPSRSEASTVGGMIARNSGGSRSLRYGTASDHVEELRVVWANGEVAQVGVEPWPSFDDEPTTDFKSLATRKVAALLARHADLIARQWPKSPRNRAGYALHDLKRDLGLDLARLLVGSEGTLALCTEARLRTVPIPAAQAVVLLEFARLADAALAVSQCLVEHPTACELVDWRTINLLREGLPSYRDWIAEDAQALLVVEFEDDDPALLPYRTRSLVNRFRASDAIVAEPLEAFKRADCDRLLGLRAASLPLLMRMKGPERPVPLVEDVAVPPAVLPEFLQQLQNIFKDRKVNWTLYGHAGAGQLHIRPLLDLSSPADVAKLEALAEEVYSAAWAAGGTISGEHGCGLARTQFLRRQYGEVARVFGEIKYAFDPQNLLNPGKIVGDEPHLLTLNLRSMPKSAPVEASAAGGLVLPVLDEQALRWGEKNGIGHSLACNGCGSCRSLETSLRMCPSFRALRTEAATPRARAQLLRQFASGALDPKLWGTEELKEVADLCVHCHLCESECPSGVDVSGLMLEAKAAFVENHGLAPTDWMLSRVELWSRIGSRMPALCNALLSNRMARWVFERLFGLSRYRRLPPAHRTPFVRRAERIGLTRPRPQEPGPRVAYFVDIFANYYDQKLAEAVVAVLQHAGVNVFVPRSQRGCGMPALVAGDLDHARDLALANLRALGDAVRDGYTVVCSEPTATLMIRHEYLKLTDDLDAHLVAENTMDVGQYLAGLAARGSLPQPHDPLRAKVGYHQPCHLRALGAGTPGLDLVRTIPDLTVEFIDRGCSGMAGTFGLTRANFRTSLRAGRGLLSRLRDDDIELGATECGACRMQMEQSVPKRTVHPMKLLSLGYGLDPALRRTLKEPKPKRAIS
ncbi:MAG TPA: FAD-linked oxidase C-terminal domain-containing protein [Isosphaeraceae bacterium]|nr:FAD-linked oxidase C-terminal domain-containing protein [Isosphaeraceae bacterium]